MKTLLITFIAERRSEREPGARVLISRPDIYTRGKEHTSEVIKYRGRMVHGCMGDHHTDLKIWLFSRNEERKNIENTCKTAWKIVSHSFMVS
jgi:hypothetical protein